MARQVFASPGNYLAFFSSFDYLQQAVDRLQERHPHVAIWTQSRGMSAIERDGFLARFTDDSYGIGFAVLGGAFAEGIDLPGRRLVGAFIATLGLPPPSAATEILRRRMDSAFGEGYAYAYLYQEFRR